MGCLSSFEIGQAENPGFRGQYALNQNEYNAQYAKKRNQNVVIPLPDPKLFEFDPNFLKNCDNIEKRTYSDYEAEFSLFQYNRDIYPGCETILLMPTTKNQVVSSSAIKELVTFGCSIDKYVPKCLIKQIEEKFKK